MFKKIYTRRDSAIAALKNAGVKAEDYDKHIGKVAAGFEVEFEGEAPTKKAKAPKVNKAAKVKKEKDPSKRKPGSGAFIRNLIKTTKLDNQAILDRVKKTFSDSKATTKDVSWNRSQMKAGKFA